MSTGAYRSPRLTQICTGDGVAAGVPRGTYTGHWRISTKARRSGGPPGVGAGPTRHTHMP